jgi:hypothetical protein
VPRLDLSQLPDPTPEQIAAELNGHLAAAITTPARRGAYRRYG